MNSIPLDLLVLTQQLAIGPVIVGLFCVSQVSLTGSMPAFIRDMNLALAAVRLEIRH